MERILGLTQFAKDNGLPVFHGEIDGVKNTELPNLEGYENYYQGNKKEGNNRAEDDYNCKLSVYPMFRETIKNLGLDSVVVAGFDRDCCAFSTVFGEKVSRTSSEIHQGSSASSELNVYTSAMYLLTDREADPSGEMPSYARDMILDDSFPGVYQMPAQQKDSAGNIDNPLGQQETTSSNSNLSRHSTLSSLPEALAQEKAEAKAQKKADKAEAKAQKLAEKAEADAARQADRERLRFNPAQDAAKPKRMNEETAKSAADAALASLDKRDAQKAADIAATDKKLSVFQQVDQAKWKAVRNQDYAKDVPPPPVPAPKAAFGRMPQPLPSIPENAAARSGPGTSQSSLSLIPGKMQKTPNPPDHDPMGSTLAVNAAPDAPSHSLWGSTIAVNNASNPPNHDPMGSTLAVNAAPDAPSHSLWGSTNAVNNTPNPPRHEPGAQEEPRVPPMMERWAQNR
ncbi:hypothetical protein [Leisingera sp. S232]|uniref:hypothetical protein n=1 Tax=Leisingera sp. S232 TaxID=3415132 RepID=UPI003C7B55DF